MTVMLASGRCLHDCWQCLVNPLAYKGCLFAKLFLQLLMYDRSIGEGDSKSPERYCQGRLDELEIRQQNLLSG